MFANNICDVPCWCGHEGSINALLYLVEAKGGRGSIDKQQDLLKFRQRLANPLKISDMRKTCLNN